MEILTSMTFWIIIIVIIVLLAIIGYIAEGTILAGKKQDKKKDENKTEKEALSAWAEDSPVDDKRQETVYTTADQSWLDMPDLPNASATTPEQATSTTVSSDSAPEPINEPVVPAEPATPTEAIAKTEEKTEMPDKESTEPLKEQPVPEPINEPVVPAEPATPTEAIAKTEEKTEMSDKESTEPDVAEKEPQKRTAETNQSSSQEKAKSPESLDVWTN